MVAMCDHKTGDRMWPDLTHDIVIKKEGKEIAQHYLLIVFHLYCLGLLGDSGPSKEHGHHSSKGLSSQGFTDLTALPLVWEHKHVETV